MPKATTPITSACPKPARAPSPTGSRRQVGVRQRAFAVSGKGETAPIAPNETATGADDPAGRTKNRRVEVILPR